MSDYACDVLFFGSIAVTLTDLCVSGAAFQHEAQRTDSRLRVRASLTPLDPATSERLSESAVSRDHAMRSTALDDTLYVPVMLAAALEPTEAPAPLSLGPSDDALRVELALEVSVVRGQCAFPVARRTAIVHSLLDVAGDACGVVTARVSDAVVRRSGAWPPARGHSPDGRGPTNDKEKEKDNDREENNEDEDSDKDKDSDDEWSGAELHCVVRALDLSRPLRSMLSAEASHRSLLRLAPRGSTAALRFAGAAQPLPYGSIPLTALYTHYRLFFEQYFNRPLRHSSIAAAELSRGAEPNRWAAPSAVDLRRALLGEAALAPVLAAVSHAEALAALRVDQNAAGDLSACWIAALFSAHRHLREVTARGNDICESGAEQLLRLARRNHAIVRMDAGGNVCSPGAIARMERVVAANADAIAADGFNVLAASFKYAVSPASFPSAVTRRALGVWAMLSALPIAMDAEDESDSAHMDMNSNRDGDLTLIPPCAAAPLLSEVVRTVARRVAAATRDHWVRAAFADVRSHTDEALCNAEDLYAGSFLRIVVVTMRSLARAADWAESAEVLREVGRRQREMGVMPEDYRLAVRVFIEALSTVCGKERTDAESAVAFLQCLAIGIRTAVAV